jgi:hypothetical protein
MTMSLKLSSQMSEGVREGPLFISRAPAVPHFYASETQVWASILHSLGKQSRG